jgi:hypothetical protein
MSPFGSHEISYLGEQFHLAVCTSQNWFSRMILTSLKMYACRNNCGALQVRYLIAPTRVRIMKNMYLTDGMDFKLSGVRLHVTC